jgi:hypothetical protein
MKKHHLVKIEWRDPCSDWPWFFIIGFDGEWVHLRGADYPDGTGKHDGSSFWVHRNEIKSMIDA